MAARCTVRKATVVEPEQRARALYDALGVDAAPGGVKEAGGSVVRLLSLRTIRRRPPGVGLL